MGIDTVNPTLFGIDFQSESLICEEEFLDTTGLRGYRSRQGERVRQSVRRIHGNIRFQPNSVELSHLLPWILGGTPSGNTYPLADALTSRFVQIDRVAKVFLYDHVFVNRATFHSAERQPLEVSLDLIGVDETVGASGSWAHPTIDIANGPFMFQDLVLVANSTTVTAKEWTLVIDNVLDADRFFNSTTLSTGTNARDRHVTMTTRLPFNDFYALYATGVGGVAATATFTNANAVFTVPIQNWKLPRIAPSVPNREQEIMLPLSGLVYRTGTTLEFGAGMTLAVGP